MEAHRLRRLLRFLRRDFPVPNGPVQVVRRRLPVVMKDGVRYGWAIRRKGRKGFRIVLNANLGVSLTLEVLLHEYAHVLTWKAEKRHHGPKWARFYANLREWFQGEGKWEWVDESEVEAAGSVRGKTRRTGS